MIWKYIESLSSFTLNRWAVMKVCLWHTCQNKSWTDLRLDLFLPKSIKIHWMSPFTDQWHYSTLCILRGTKYRKKSSAYLMLVLLIRWCKKLKNMHWIQIQETVFEGTHPILNGSESFFVKISQQIHHFDGLFILNSTM